MVYDFQHIDALWDFAVAEFEHGGANGKAYAAETVKAHLEDFLKNKKDHEQIIKMLTVAFVAQNYKELISAGFTIDEIEAELNKYGGSIKSAAAASAPL
jgi:hypothetical protein